MFAANGDLSKFRQLSRATFGEVMLAIKYLLLQQDSKQGKE